MNSSSSSSMALSEASHTYNKENDLITVTEKVNLTKNQHEVLQMICNSYMPTRHFINIQNCLEISFRADLFLNLETIVILF